ncbi:hypothetical protein ACI65C_001171 [Semiaphis heraclei]
MHKCLVCSNSSGRTRITRPEVMYHAFPKNDYRRRKWLKVLGLDGCYDWHRVCSDHFLEENYKPGGKRLLKKNAVPQPLQNFDGIGFPSNYATQSTNIETDNNELLSREQNLLRDERNAIVNSFESPRRSCRKIKLTTTNEDMSYENMPRLQTERFERQIPTFIANDNIQTVNERILVPMLTTTKDYTVGSGVRCSVKNCYNRYSNDLSFFGYPSDFTLRKIWIEKCGLELDPTEKVKTSLRVCRVHFANDCFVNALRKNRLKPDAVPSLFLYNDIIDARNKPSPVSSGIIRVNKRSSVNNGFVRANKPSCSSSNYVANVNSEQTELFVYIDSTIRYAKDFQACCAVQGCITNFIEEVEDISLFAPTKESVNEWSSILGLQLTVNSMVCERHFRQQDILYPNLMVNGETTKVKSLIPFALPVPTISMQFKSDVVQSASDVVQSVSNVVQSASDVVQSASDVVQSASDVMPLETNVVPILRTYEGNFKREQADEQLSKKKIKIDVLDESKATTSINENKEYNTVTNNTHQFNSTFNVDPTLNSNTVIPVDLSIVKIEPCDYDDDVSQTNLETETEQILPMIKPEPVEDCDPLPLSSIDDSLSISIKKLQNISAKSSLSITLEPIDKPKITRPSVNLSSETPAKSSMSITLQPKLHNNLSSTANNSSSSISLHSIHSLPSTSSSSMYNTTQQSLPSTSSSSMYNTTQHYLPSTSSSSMYNTTQHYLPSTSSSSIYNTTQQSLPSTSSSSMYNTTQQSLPSTSTSSMYNTTQQSLPSTSSSSMYNTTQQTLLRNEQKTTSTIRMPHKLSSNTVIQPKSIERRFIYLKPISPSNQSNFSESPKIKTPVISKCISLARKPHTYNSNYRTNTSDCVIIDDDDTEGFVEEDDGFIYEISKSVLLPSVFWKIVHNSARNSTTFYQRCSISETVKNILFDNSLLPTIHIYGKKYEYNKPIKTKNELQNLIEKIDCVEKCYGFEGLAHDNCIGYYEGNLEDVHSCSSCLEKYQELHNFVGSKTKTIESIEQNISERTARVLELKETMEKNRRNRSSREEVPT